MLDNDSWKTGQVCLGLQPLLMLQGFIRLQDLEANNQRLEAEVRRVSQSASASTANQESLSGRIEDLERSSKAAARQHEQQVRLQAEPLLSQISCLKNHA